MKRNTLMKRLAVAALAATMTVGMAVPAMAAQGTVSGSKTNPAGQRVYTTTPAPQGLDTKEAINYAEWFTLKSWNDTAKIKLNSDENDTTADFWLDDAGNVYTYQLTGYHYNVLNGVNFDDYDYDQGETLSEADVDALKNTDHLAWLQDQGYVEKTAYKGNSDGKFKGQYAVKKSIDNAADKNAISYDSTNKKYYYWYDKAESKNQFDWLVNLKYISADPVADYGWKKVTTQSITTVNYVDGAAEFTVGDVNDDGYAVVWTIKNLNDNYFNTKVDKNTFELTPDKFGTTVYEYTGKLYHGGKYVGTTKGDVTGYFAVTMPLNKDTINELVDKAVKNVVSTNGVNSAASDGKKAVQDYVNSKDPKVWEFETLTNNAHTLDVDVNTVNEFHAATGFKAHVWVTDKDANGNKKITYDYGIKDFAFAKAAVKFTDVADTAYYAPSVYWGVEKGLVKGKSDTTFAPYDNLTREQLIVMLYRQAGSPAVAINEKFDDLTGLSDESKKAISWGVQNGIVNGTTEVKFSPKEAVNRAQVVTMLFRLAGSPKNYNETNFTDVAHGSYYEDAVDWAVNQKIVLGKSETTFDPKADTTRAQGITLLDRYFNR